MMLRSWARLLAMLIGLAGSNAPEPPQPADPAVKAARDDARRRAAGLQGYGSTIATSGLGLAGAPAPNTTGFKTLLGQ